MEIACICVFECPGCETGKVVGIDACPVCKGDGVEVYEVYTDSGPALDGGSCSNCYGDGRIGACTESCGWIPLGAIESNECSCDRDSLLGEE